MKNNSGKKEKPSPYDFYLLHAMAEVLVEDCIIPEVPIELLLIMQKNAEKQKSKPEQSHTTWSMEKPMYGASCLRVEMSNELRSKFKQVKKEILTTYKEKIANDPARKMKKQIRRPRNKKLLGS